VVLCCLRVELCCIELGLGFVLVVDGVGLLRVESCWFVVSWVLSQCWTWFGSEWNWFGVELSLPRTELGWFGAELCMTGWR
jgi:hypothetical protein